MLDEVELSVCDPKLEDRNEGRAAESQLPEGQGHQRVYLSLGVAGCVSVPKKSSIVELEALLV